MPKSTENTLPLIEVTELQPEDLSYDHQIEYWNSYYMRYPHEIPF